jgi:hypothetical protein
MSDPEKQCRSQKQHNKKCRSAAWTLSSQENHILLDLLTPRDSRSPPLATAGNVHKNDTTGKPVNDTLAHRDNAVARTESNYASSCFRPQRFSR